MSCCTILYMPSVSLIFTLANMLYCFDWELPGGMKYKEMLIEEVARWTNYS